MRLIALGWFGILFLVSGAGAAEYRWGGFSFETAERWNVLQKAEDHGARFIILNSRQNPQDQLALYYQPEQPRTSADLFVPDVRILGTTDWDLSEFNWQVRQGLIPDSGTHYLTAFSAGSFSGVSRSDSRERSENQARELLATFRRLNERSLTDEEFTGRKYYVGFGDYLTGFMGNEVKYDIKHTHDLFTSQFGGNYLGTKLVGSSVDDSELRAEWDRVGKQMTWQDMYVQYSSGHGYEQGLAFGVDYNEIRDNALSYPAKEIIIFIMACHSGGLVDSFNQKKSIWSQWADYGRTLFVMASSTVEENSSTGPITDKDEPGGPDGSAGSAFGHALWKSLIGYADGFVDGVKDGFVSLGEIEGYAGKLTYTIGGHRPVTTGVYNPALVLSRVPPKEVLSRLEGTGSENLSDSEIQQRIRQLEREWRIRSR